jgi:hypothetical protein
VSTVIFALFFIGLGVLMIWGIKETWNDPGMSEEKFDRLFRKNR